MSPTGNPQGRADAVSSSSHPSTPRDMPRRIESTSASAKPGVAANASRSASGVPGEPTRSSGVSAASDNAASSKPARSGSGDPVASARSSAWSSSACHSNHAGPTSSGGAAPASTAHARTRSGSKRRARERRRSTARPAGDEERGGPEMVGERDGVRGFLRDDAAGAAGRALVARARVRDRSDASRRGGRGDLREGHGRARRPHVEDEQRFRVLRSRPAELQRPPAGHPHRLHPHRGSLARTPPRLSVRTVKMGTHARTGSVLGDVRR